MPTRARKEREAARLQQQQQQAEELAQLRTAVAALQSASAAQLAPDPEGKVGGLVVTHAAPPGPSPLDTPPMIGPWDHTRWLFSAEAFLPATTHLPWQLMRCIGGCNGEMWTKNPQHDDICENCLFLAYSDDIDHAARQARRLGSHPSRIIVDPFH